MLIWVETEVTVFLRFTHSPDVILHPNFLLEPRRQRGLLGMHTQKLMNISNNQYSQALFTSSHFLLLERIVLLYDKSSVLESVNLERLDLLVRRDS